MTSAGSQYKHLIRHWKAIFHQKNNEIDKTFFITLLDANFQTQSMNIIKHYRSIALYLSNVQAFRFEQTTKDDYLDN